MSAHLAHFIVLWGIFQEPVLLDLCYIANEYFVFIFLDFMENHPVRFAILRVSSSVQFNKGKPNRWQSLQTSVNWDGHGV